MDAQDLFGTVITLFVGAVLILAVSGSDPSFLINIAPQVVMFAFLLAFSLATLRSIAQ